MHGHGRWAEETGTIVKNNEKELKVVLDGGYV